MYLNKLSILFTIGIFLQIICPSYAVKEDYCASYENEEATKCRILHKSSTIKDFRVACCNVFAIENCIVSRVPDNCKKVLMERYENDSLKKGQCKQFLNKCDNSNQSTSNSNFLDTSDKPESPKQLISNYSPPATLSESNLLANEPITNGAFDNLANRCVTLVIGCSTFILINLVQTRWIN